MTSAGQQYLGPQQPGYPPQQQGYYPPQQQPQGPAFVMPQLLPVGTFQPPAFNMNFEDANMSDVPKVYWWGQGIAAVGGMAGNVLNSIFNYELSSQAMTDQRKIAIKYYDTQDAIAGYQKDVALEQLSVQGDAIAAQVEMHGNQVNHEQEMGKLEKSTRVVLAKISEDGRTERAKVLSMGNAFARGGWDMGTPMFG